MSGHTPLVGWLKPYMIPEVIGLKVPDSVLSTAPSDYTGAKQTIQDSNEQLKKLKDFLDKKNQTSKELMESEIKGEDSIREENKNEMDS